MSQIITRYVLFVVITIGSFHHSWHFTRLITWVTRWVPLVEQELLVLPEHLSSPLFLVGFVLLNLLFSVSCFADHFLSFCTFLFCCVSFDNLRRLITPVISSHLSHNRMLYRSTSLEWNPETNVISSQCLKWCFIYINDFIQILIIKWLNHVCKQTKKNIFRICM